MHFSLLFVLISNGGNLWWTSEWTCGAAAQYAFQNYGGCTRHLTKSGCKSLAGRSSHYRYVKAVSYRKRWRYPPGCFTYKNTKRMYYNPNRRSFVRFSWWCRGKCAKKGTKWGWYWTKYRTWRSWKWNRLKQVYLDKRECSRWASSHRYKYAGVASNQNTPHGCYYSPTHQVYFNPNWNTAAGCTSANQCIYDTFLQAGSCARPMTLQDCQSWARHYGVRVEGSKNTNSGLPRGCSAHVSTKYGKLSYRIFFDQWGTAPCSTTYRCRCGQSRLRETSTCVLNGGLASMAECSRWAATMSRKWRGASVAAGRPQGCFMNVRGDVYYNNRRQSPNTPCSRNFRCVCASGGNVGSDPYNSTTTGSNTIRQGGQCNSYTASKCVSGTYCSATSASSQSAACINQKSTAPCTCKTGTQGSIRQGAKCSGQTGNCVSGTSCVFSTSYGASQAGAACFNQNSVAPCVCRRGSSQGSIREGAKCSGQVGNCVSGTSCVFSRAYGTSQAGTACINQNVTAPCVCKNSSDSTDLASTTCPVGNAATVQCKCGSTSCSSGYVCVRDLTSGTCLRPCALDVEVTASCACRQSTCRSEETCARSTMTCNKDSSVGGLSMETWLLIVAAVVAALIICAISFFLIRRFRKKQEKELPGSQHSYSLGLASAASQSNGSKASPSVQSKSIPYALVPGGSASNPSMAPSASAPNPFVAPSGSASNPSMAPSGSASNPSMAPSGSASNPSMAPSASASNPSMAPSASASNPSMAPSGSASNRSMAPSGSASNPSIVSAISEPNPSMLSNVSGGTTPGTRGARPGTPTNPGTRGTNPGTRGTTPGTRGVKPGTPTTPGTRGARPGTPTTPGTRGARPGTPTNPGTRGTQQAYPTGKSASSGKHGAAARKVKTERTAPRAPRRHHSKDNRRGIPIQASMPTQTTAGRNLASAAGPSAIIHKTGPNSRNYHASHRSR